MTNKFINEETLGILIILYSITLILFSLNITSSLTMIGEIPDFCLPYETQYYDLILDDYYSIGQFDEIEILVDDPVNGNLLRLPLGYSTLNLQYFELAYYYDNIELKDIVRFETYNQNISFDVTIYPEDAELQQNFIVTVQPDCSTVVEEEPVYHNFSDAIFDNLIAYFSFDETLQDSYNDYDATRVDGDAPAYSSDSMYEQSIYFNSSYSVNLSEAFDLLPSTNMTISFWFNMSENASTTEYLLNCDDFDVFFQNSYGGNFSHINDNLWFSLQGGTASTPQNTSDGNWHHFVYMRNTTEERYEIYIDNQFRTNVESVNRSFGNCLLGMSTDSLKIDDVTLFNKSLSPSEVSTLYNSGNGYDFSQVSSPNVPNSSVIPDVYLNGSNWTFIDLDSYFGDWQDMYVSAPDPINNRTHRLYTGYGTINADYYELVLHTNGTLNITAYERPYEFNVSVYACNYTPYEECSNENFTVFINANLSSVIQVNQMQAYYDLGFTGRQIFSGNYFFQYYENIRVSYPESNFTGILNSTFPHSYTELDVPINNASYMVFMDCDISQGLQTTNYLGDVNITLECGSNQVYYTFTAYNNYNQEISFYAWNDHSSLTLNTTILAGNYNQPSGYTPSNITASTDPLDDNFFSFGTLLPSGLSTTNKNRMVFMILLVINAVIFVALFRSSVSLAFYTCLVVSIFMMFLFVSADFLSPAYPILLLVFVLVSFGIKFIRGGL